MNLKAHLIALFGQLDDTPFWNSSNRWINERGIGEGQLGSNQARAGAGWVGAGWANLLPLTRLLRPDDQQLGEAVTRLLF